MKLGISAQRLDEVDLTRVVCHVSVCAHHENLAEDWAANAVDELSIHVFVAQISYGVGKHFCAFDDLPLGIARRTKIRFRRTIAIFPTQERGKVEVCLDALGRDFQSGTRGLSIAQVLFPVQHIGLSTSNEVGHRVSHSDDMLGHEILGGHNRIVLNSALLILFFTQA